jgi:hypothetical protein
MTKKIRKNQDAEKIRDTIRVRSTPLKVIEI